MTAGSTVAPSVANGAALWVRATLSVNNGSSGNTTTFYTSSDGSTWAQLGSAVVNSGTTSIADTSDSLEVGSSFGGYGGSVNGKIYYADVRNVINGSITNKFDPNDASSASPASWASSASASENWTVNRSGTNSPADVASDLTTTAVTGLPSGGNANVRFIDAIATYNFTPASIPAATPCTLSLQGFTNTATAGSYSSLIKTYDNTGPPPAIVDSVTTATLTFSDDSSSSTVSVAVDPSFTFSVAGRSSVCNGQSAMNFQNGATATAVSLGHLSSANVGGGAQDLTVSTNAANGFTVYLRTSGTTPNALRDVSSHSIADVSGTNASPGSAPTAGTAGFGYTSNDTSTPFTSNTWARLTNTNDGVLIGPGGTASKSACVGYEVAVSSTTPAGSYSSNIVYTATPNF